MTIFIKPLNDDPLVGHLSTPMQAAMRPGVYCSLSQLNMGGVTFMIPSWVHFKALRLCRASDRCNVLHAALPRSAQVLLPCVSCCSVFFGNYLQRERETARYMGNRGWSQHNAEKLD